MTGELSLLAALCVILGGGAGSWLRWRVDSWIKARDTTDLMTSLIVINTVGSLALGLTVGVADRFDGSWWLTALVATGLCGGFTTFSSASVEAVELLRQRRTLAGLASVAVIAAGAVAAFGLGWWIAG